MDDNFYTLITTTIDIALWDAWLKSAQDFFIESGEGPPAYFKLVFWIVIVFVGGVGAVAILKIIIDMLFPLRKTWDAVRPVLLPVIDSDAPPHPFLDFFLLSVLSWVYVNNYYNSDFFDNDLFKIALINVQIIGLLIAVTFSFSIFAMQRMTSFLPNQYMNFFVGYRETRPIFLPLVFLILVSLFFPLLSPQYPKFAFWGLLTILFGCFFLVYNVYIKLIEKITPNYFLEKIASYITKDLEACKKAHANLYKDDEASLLFGVASDHVKGLQEIGIRLLKRNEMGNFNMVLFHIKNTYLNHLILGDGCFIGEKEHPNHLKDKGLLIDLNICLSSLVDYSLVQENNEDSVVSFRMIYKDIIQQVLCTKHANEAKDSIILDSIFSSYEKFIAKTFALKDGFLTYTATQDLLEISKIVFQKLDDFQIPACAMLCEMLEGAAKQYPKEQDEINSTISELKKKMNRN